MVFFFAAMASEATSSAVKNLPDYNDTIHLANAATAVGDGASSAAAMV
jgi:hypothetical protein